MSTELETYLKEVQKSIYTITGVTVDELEVKKIVSDIYIANYHYKKSITDKYQENHNSERDYALKNYNWVDNRKTKNLKLDYI